MRAAQAINTAKLDLHLNIRHGHYEHGMWQRRGAENEGAMLADLIDLGWRRSGTYLYKVCRQLYMMYMLMASVC